MQKFHFKLQPLLKKERIYEDECIGRLRDIQAKLKHEEDEIKNLKRRRIVSENELKSKKKDEISPDELRAYECYFLKLISDVDSCEAKKQEISKELSFVQDELFKIIKRRKALEKLRDRWKAEHRSHLAFLSNKEMDDTAMTKFTNKLVVGND
ncbi:MAG: flagellar export protein FliJ [Candidatus Brocadiaceae bacterium]|nr:flagellar export protein FliJ [Candidatus Brocadiaceae bacterium]